MTETPRAIDVRRPADARPPSNPGPESVAGPMIDMAMDDASGRGSSGRLPCLDWLVVGGGIHGVHVAARLVGEAGVDAERLRILDPGAELLCRWRARAAITGMTHLRSPGVHHLDLEPHSLIHFAGQRRNRERGLLEQPYDRPALELFDAHCDRVLDRFDLKSLHVRDAAADLVPGPDGVRVRTIAGEHIEARRVVLAIGSGDQPAYPDWAPKGDRRAGHVFDPSFRWPEATRGETLLVVGGGISAAQVALRLVDQGSYVHLVSRHPLRTEFFDSDPGWLGPKLMPIFRQERDLCGRRRLLGEARHRGTVTPKVYRALRREMAEQRLFVHESEVVGAELDGSPDEGGVRLELGDGRRLDGTRLLLATGFEGRRPGGALVDRLAYGLGLPCARCGYPVVDALLRWHPRIHVTGPLAELELGPVARNIAGARRAADRLVEAHGHLRASVSRISVP